MKKTISIIAVVVVIVILIVVVRSDKSAKPVVTETPVETATSTPGVIAINDIKVADGVYTINPKDIKITWTGRKVILKNWIDSGIISLKEGTFEIKNNAAVSNKFVIDMTSITGKTTGAGKNEDKLTTHLKSADFFDVEKFPTATFVAKEFTADMSTSTLIANTKKFIVKGDMTIKGITNEIAIPVTFTRTDGKNITAQGSVDLDRTKWDVRYGSGKFFQNLGDNVIDDMFNITFDMTLNIASSTTK